jgi:hypothetical protein
MGRCYEYIKGAHHRDDIAPLTNTEICWSPNWNEPRIAMGTPQFGILTNPYPNRFGDLLRILSEILIIYSGPDYI